MILTHYDSNQHCAVCTGKIILMISTDYKGLLPSRPHVIDSVNPANNVWESGFWPPGYSALFLEKIISIDLSIPIA